MKISFLRKACLGLAVSLAAVTGNFCQAQDQSTSPADDSALPANIQPGSPLAEVVKLVQAGVDADTIKSYVNNSAGAFNLDADTIIFLKDEGLPSDAINAMLEHDKDFTASPPASVPAPAISDETTTDAATAPPAAPVTVDYFNNTLSPYGSWVDIAGYGRCWRPTVMIYDSSWQPYCDRGHWVYTDYGWYWDSDYSWGITFHYGRWFHDPRWGWCWWPDTVWSASWVTWRSSDDYCGWAPLPPFTVFQPGVGFYYRGVAVAAGFDFGLDANFFMFIPISHISDRRPRTFCVARPQVSQIYGRTTIVNNFSVHDRFVINGGISVDRINTITHRDIRPVGVSEVRNAQRQGWRGNVPNAGTRTVNDNRQPGFNQPTPMGNRIGNNTAPSRPQTFTSPDNRSGNRNFNTPEPVHPGVNPAANNNPTPGTPFNRDRQNTQPPGNARHTLSPPAANDVHRQIGSPFTATPAQQPHQAAQLTRPPATPDLPTRGDNRPNNAAPLPRNAGPANPPQPQQSQQPQTQQRNSGKDKQNN